MARKIIKVPAFGDPESDEYSPAYERHYYYVATFGKIEAELDVEPEFSESGAAIHMEAIRYAEGCMPPPSQVLYVEEVHGTRGEPVKPTKRLIYSFIAENQGPIKPAPVLPLDVALDQFMGLAFTNGEDQVNWRGPVGINDAIRNLKVSYFTHKPEKLGETSGDGRKPANS